MSEQDENIQATNPVEPSQEQPQEQSLADALRDADDKTTDQEQQPEAPVEEGANPEEQPAEQEPTQEAQKPTEEEPEQQETDAERKQRFYEMRQAQKQAKQQMEQSISQAYQPQSNDELVNQFVQQGYNQFEAEMLARDERRTQEAAIAREGERISQLNNQFGTEAVQVMHDYPVFDPKSKEYDKDFANKAAQLFESHAGVQKDRNGIIVNASASPYQFYKELAEMRGHSAAKAQVQAQRNAEAQMAAAAPPSSTHVPTPKSDEDAQADRMKAAWDKTA